MKSVTKTGLKDCDIKPMTMITATTTTAAATITTTTAAAKPPHKGSGPVVLTGYDHVRPNAAKQWLREPKIGCILLSPGD